MVRALGSSPKCGNMCTSITTEPLCLGGPGSSQDDLVLDNGTTSRRLGADFWQSSHLRVTMATANDVGSVDYGSYARLFCIILAMHLVIIAVALSGGEGMTFERRELLKLFCCSSRALARLKLRRQLRVS